jgi:hypothetical protein
MVMAEVVPSELIKKLSTSASLRLPIDVIPNTEPPQFKWEQRVQTPVGQSTVKCNGGLPPGVECAVRDLITIAKRQHAEIVELKKQLLGFADRITAQSEILSAHAEKKPESTPAHANKKRG